MRKCALALSVIAVAATPLRSQTPDAFFESSVRPLLIGKCNGCHTGANAAGKLRLDSRDSILAGGSRGPAVIPAKPAESLLMRAVRHQEGNLRMPPGPKLTDAEIARLTQWIEMGAPWGKSTKATAPAEQYWSFEAPADPAPPAVKNKPWIANPIDSFILAKLEEKGLKPAAAAGKRTLIRRATYDLTGLPPTPEETAAFLADPSPRAFEKVVDRLLASPRYGERWGRHWLDVARYADSNGLDENLVYRNAWRYRDYVIAALNADKPYDQFIQEQLAGDLLPPASDPNTTFERWTATGFLSLGAKMLAEDDPIKMEMDIIDEQVDTLARTFMGLTVGCARCHDHKFDPIPQTDYYGLAGIFKSTKTMENFKVVAKWHEYVLAPEADRTRLETHLARIEAKSEEAAAIRRAENKRITDEAKRKAGAYLLAAYEVQQAPKLHPLPAGAAMIAERAAASFDSGNVEKTIEPKKTNVPKGGKGPFFAEYKVQAARAGDYQIELLDEESGAGTADLWIGGVLMKRGNPPVQNREASPDAGGWSPLGIFPLAQGENVIRLEHERRFPYFASLRVAPSPLAPGSPAPRTKAQIARHFGVNPSILEQMVEHLERSNGAPASVLYAFENAGKQAGKWQSPAAALFAEFASANREQIAARYQELFIQALDKEDAALKPLRELLNEKFGPFRAPEDARRYYPAEATAKLARLDSEKAELEKQTPEFPQAMGVRDYPKPVDLKVHVRGDYLNLGAPAPRGFLRAIALPGQPEAPAQSSGRLELARWLTRKDHPLTARVMVNRLWRWHFGRGIVASTDNFGRLGDKPVNQPLLDWLSHRFIEKGWSLKEMHRLIMNSNTYKMSSGYRAEAFEADPENTLQWRANRRRLEAEAMRDAIMAVSGGLNLVQGGTILDYKDRQYVANTSKRGGVDYERSIRAVYIPVVRSSMYDVFRAFDLPDPSTPQGDRNATIVAPQALFMMNGAVVLEHSRKMAESLVAMNAPDDAARIRHAYEKALTRPPEPREVDQALTFLAQIEKALPADVTDRRVRAWQSFCKALIASNEFVYVN